MKNKIHFFKDVTLLVTHYNRSRSLEHLLQSFRSINCLFEDIVVSDDGSKPEHLDYLVQLQQQYTFRVITTPINKGLGNNINKGQDAVRTPYTLYVQEDFEPANNFALHFGHALEIMQERKDIDVVRFYAYFKYPYLRQHKHGFSFMQFAWWLPGYKKFYAYSDHPHLRRSNFLEKFGRYAEGVKGDVTEYGMMMSFLKHRGKALFYEDYRNLFYQKNSAAEPSTMKRNYWRESNNIMVHVMREAYRHLKFNYDLFFRF
jgi:glycosyltransferase involved in cell wall biosynthesis